MLELAGLDRDAIEASIAMARRFEAHVRQPGNTPTAETAWAFSRLLIEEGMNNRANYMALVRYCRFIRDDEAMVAFLELVDGGEVGENLYRMVGERFGLDIRDEVFAGIGVAPYGTPSPEKPAYVQPVVSRLERQIGAEASSEFLSACLRDLPAEYFLPEYEMYSTSADIDDYLRQRKDAFMAELEACQREGRLFFAQEITQGVLDFVRNDPEIGGGRRVGNVIYETKIPYMAQKYLDEDDPTTKRYYACHCPWARDAIRKGDVEPAKTFCQCSGGFHKKPLEAALGKPLRVEVLESALRGDTRCRFAIYLETDTPGAG